MTNYKELVAALREEAEAVKAVEWDIPICTSNHVSEAADVIEQNNEIIASLQRELVETEKERDAYAKCFRITRTDEPFTNHAVFKVDYKDLICHTEEEIANALVYGFARIINEHRVVQEVEHEID